MRVAQARLAQGILASRAGDPGAAVDLGQAALGHDRRCLPSLLLAATDLDRDLRSRYPRDARAGDFHHRVRQLSRSTQSR